MPVVACLHTAASNAPEFDAACPRGMVLRHAIRADPLAEAEREGGVSESLASRAAEVPAALAREASAQASMAVERAIR